MKNPTETAANQEMLITAQRHICCYVGKSFAPTVGGSLGFTSHLSNPIAIAVTSVVKAVDDFVPGVSNLIEGFSLWFLTLICHRSAEEKVVSQIQSEYCDLVTTAGATNTPRASHFHRPRPWP